MLSIVISLWLFVGLQKKKRRERARKKYRRVQEAIEPYGVEEERFMSCAASTFKLKLMLACYSGLYISQTTTVYMLMKLVIVICILSVL